MERHHRRQVTSLASKLRRAATRLETQKGLKKRSPPGTNLLDEDISVSPSSFPGIITHTMGGPDRKKLFRQAPIEGPRGIACGEEEDEKMVTKTADRLRRVARRVLALRRVQAALDLNELREKVAKINAAIQSGRLPPNKMAQAAQTLAQLTMQMAQAVEAAQKSAA